MNSYDLSRNWFNWAFENPSKITPTHGVLYFFCIEHCNRLGWKKEFGLPTTMAKEAIGVRSYNTYVKALNDLVEWGFIELIEKSKNQYSSNIIALSKFDKAPIKALDKALIKHASKQSESTSESIDSIDKQETIKKKQETINNKPKKPKGISNLSLIDFPKMQKEIFELWEFWVAYKWEQHKQEYKSSQSELIALRKFWKDYTGDFEKMKAAVENSISSLYKGIFAPDEKKKQLNKTDF